MPGILFITPPYIKLRNITPRLPPLGIAYLASYIERKNIPVSIYDSFIEKATFRDIEKRIIKSKELFVGIGSTTAGFQEAIMIASIAKRHGKKVVIGGSHISALPVQTLQRYEFFDYGVIGEGEETLHELVVGENPSKINGIVYRDGKNVIITEKRPLIKDISSLPHPARHLLKNHLYRGQDWFFSQKRGFFNIITSRGCPFQCTFCASKTVWGGHARFRKLDDVFYELDALKKMGMRQLWINDDTFAIQEDRMKEIAGKIKSLNVEWGCNSRVDEMNVEKFRYLKKSNCSIVLFGIESGNQQVLNDMKKNITLQQAKTCLMLARKIKLKTCCTFIVGNIGETASAVHDTIRFAKELKPNLALFNMLTPYPGTEAYKRALDNGYLIKDVDNYANPKYLEPVISQPNMPATNTKKLLRRAYINFYTNPKFLFRFVCDLISSRDGFKRNSRIIKMLSKIILKYFYFACCGQ